ncbi:MAG: hypothetical protein IJR36_02545 [Lachnospiraceae bacterium]|nr:hypothetical protein [Lachnospiraceae bacterium]
MKTRPFYRLVAALLCIFLILQHVPASVLAAGTEDIGMQDEHSTATSSATNDAPKSSEGFASSAAVTSELTEGRTENEKRYRLEDGSYTAVVYQEPVHVRDSSGILQEIVNKLTLDETEGRYTVTIGDVEKDYAASMSAGDLLRVSKGAYELAMSPVEETIE